jgi:hypothetical protein
MEPGPCQVLFLDPDPPPGSLFFGPMEDPGSRENQTQAIGLFCGQFGMQKDHHGSFKP